MRRSDPRPIRKHVAYLQRRIDKRIDFRDPYVHDTVRVGDCLSTITRETTLPVYAFPEVDALIRSLPIHPYCSATVRCTPRVTTVGDGHDLRRQ